MKNWSKQIAAATAVIGVMALAPAVFAQSVPTSTPTAPPYGNHTWQVKPGMAFGQITAINGNILTVLGKDGKTYTVDATSAVVTVSGQSSTLSALAVGNQIMVQGQPSSQDATQITAQTIREGMMNRGGFKGNGQYSNKTSSSNLNSKRTQKISANQMFNQVLTVTTINGTSITATGQDGTTVYTVDLNNAKLVRKFGASSSVAEISVGDSIRVFGPQPAAGSDAVTANNVRDMSIQENATLVGTVQSLGANGFTLVASNSQIYTVTVSSSTAYRTKLSQYTVGSLSDLLAGDTVRTFGVMDTVTKTDMASAVRLMNRISATAAPVQQ